MTREEAIDEITERIGSALFVDNSYADCVSIDALKMAIKALEQPEPINPCTVCQEFDCSGCKFKRCKE